MELPYEIADAAFHGMIPVALPMRPPTTAEMSDVDGRLEAAAPPVVTLRLRRYQPMTGADAYWALSVEGVDVETLKQLHGFIPNER